MEFLAEHEFSHFELEEAMLVPVVPAEPPGPDLARRVLEDHGFLRDQQELFPYLARSLSKSQLEDVGAAIRAGNATGTVQRFLRAVTELDTETLLGLADPEIELDPIRLPASANITDTAGLRQWIDELCKTIRRGRNQASAPV